MVVLSFRPRRAPVASVVGGVIALLLSVSSVRAQTQPPPVGTGSSEPVQPLPPATPPPPAVSSPPAALDAPRPVEGYPMVEAQPASAPTPGAPLYKKWWFWTAIGAFAITTVVIIAASSSSGPPKTELGNMSAF